MEETGGLTEHFGSASLAHWRSEESVSGLRFMALGGACLARAGWKTSDRTGAWKERLWCFFITWKSWYAVFHGIYEMLGVDHRQRPI